jgi:hypothetical protein
MAPHAHTGSPANGAVYGNQVLAKRGHWSALLQVSSELADCLELLGEGKRSLLANCTVYRCCEILKDDSTMYLALERIEAGVDRELPDLRPRARRIEHG